MCAGELVMEQAKTYGAEIIPVDSEHSAIFQCLMGNRDKTQIKRLILTCSGGPFYGLSRAELAEKKKADALCHPNWKMGAKITIDCATLMNKGLEIIEAMRLYDLPLEKVTAVVHRQSIVHSMVEFTDGAVMAQLGAPDMRIPISLAMTYPERKQTPAPALDLLSCPPLTFAEIDEGSFDCFRLAKEAARRGGTVCAAMNAANEEAIALYLQDAIGFYDISELVSRAMELPSVENPKLLAAVEQMGLADRTTCVQRAAYSHWEMLEFDSRAGRQSALREPSLVTGVQGAAKAKIRQVQGQALDELAGEHPVTLINMDVEGAERLALQGCRQVITRDRPKMLIAAYHRSEDLFALPQQIAAIRPDYRFYLRHYRYIPAWDVNLYCV